MDLGLKDKVFIITGGGAGIGAAISTGLATEGAKIAIIGRSPIDGTEVDKALKALSADYIFVKAELSEVEDCKNAVKAVVDHYGKIDCLVNNAGLNDTVGLQKGSPEEFVKSLSINLNHYYYMAHFAIEELKKTEGNIVNIGSKTSMTGQGNTSGYAASKGAQLALTREWAVEMLPFNVRINAVIPAEVYTPLYDKWIKTFDNPEEKLKSITSKIPLGKRFTEAEEIANMVIFLSSYRAAHMTGQQILVDGGYTHLDRSIS